MKQWILLLFIISLSGCSSPDNKSSGKPVPLTVTSTWQQGKQLFYDKCASCHMINKEMTGPALRGVESRWPDKEKLYAFIRNSQEIIAKDKYARELWLQFNQTIMLSHPDLTDAQIDQILGYIKSVSEPVNP
jgi:mono/diheme cytochrome c family protein